MAGGSFPIRGTSGPTFATIGHSADRRPRVRSITPRATGGRSIPHGIFKASPVSSRPMPIAATTSCMTPRAPRDRSRLHSVGPTLGGSSSSWRTSPPMRGETRMPRRSRRLPSRRSSASMHCSILSAASTAKAPNNVYGCAKSKAHPCWRCWKRGCASSVLGYRTPHRSPSQSTTCCAAGIGSLASSMKGGSA